MKKLLLATIIIILISVIIIIFGSKKPQIDQKLVDTANIIESVKNTIAPAPTVIKANGLPDKHLINTTFVPQAPEKIWDQPWQDACEEAALLTVIYKYQKATPSTSQIVSDLKDIFSYETSVGMTHDVNLEEMSLVAKGMFGVESKIIDTPTIDILKTYLSQDIPIIVPANGKILYKENKHFKSGGPWYHNLVILGYDDNKKQFIVHDVGTQFGSYYKYSYQLLMDSIHDFPVTGIKEDINSGDKRVLVLIK